MGPRQKRCNDILLTVIDGLIDEHERNVALGYMRYLLRSKGKDEYCETLKDFLVLGGGNKLSDFISLEGNELSGRPINKLNRLPRNLPMFVGHPSLESINRSSSRVRSRGSSSGSVALKSTLSVLD